MATKQKEPAKAAATTAAAFSTYSAAELAANAHVFGTVPEVVTAALQEAQITNTTQGNAEKIVKAFLKREVK